MSTAFDQIQNHQEQAVFAAVKAIAPAYPQMHESELLADVACVALNRLPPRYIRHVVDWSFYLTDRERLDGERAVDDAVHHAFQFVQARLAMKARA